jgi:hypothetical protein
MLTGKYVARCELVFLVGSCALEHAKVWGKALFFIFLAELLIFVASMLSLLFQLR